MEVPVVDLRGQRVESLVLEQPFWEGPPNLRLLAQAVRLYRMSQRAGTASTKTRADVSGGGKKPWRQKHTGRARAGSIRSPLWRGGGIVFGPHPRAFGDPVPTQIRRRALQESLKGKLHDQQLVILKELRAEEPKTKPFAGLAKTFEVTGRSVIVLEAFVKPLVRSLRNLQAFELKRADDLNALDVVNAQKVLVTRGAFERLQARLSKRPGGRGSSDGSGT